MASETETATGAGVLWVTSKIVEPSKLSVEAFDDWYENEHALEVLALPGVPSGTRYRALVDSDPSTPPHLITYEFPRLSYAQDPAFLAVASQTPAPPLVEKIYANVTFDIRFYAELSSSTGSLDGGDRKAHALASITLHASPAHEQALETWLARDFVPRLSATKDFLRMRRFAFVSGVVRAQNEVAVPDRPKYLVLAEFAAGEGGLRDRVEEACAGAREMGSVVVDWYGVKKVWSEDEVGKLGEAP